MLDGVRLLAEDCHLGGGSGAGVERVRVEPASSDMAGLGSPVSDTPLPLPARSGVAASGGDEKLSWVAAACKGTAELAVLLPLAALEAGV